MPVSTAEAKLWLQMVWPKVLGSGFNSTATKVQATMQAAVSTRLSLSSLKLDVVVSAVVYTNMPYDYGDGYDDGILHTYTIFNVTAKGPAGGMGVAVGDVQMLAPFTQPHSSLQLLHSTAPLT